MKTDWTERDAILSECQGWILDFGHETRICAADGQVIFVGPERDVDALLYVLRGAKRSKLCRRAVKAAFGF